MKKLLVLDVVGLTPSMLGEDTPALRALAKDGFSAPLAGVMPGVTCSAQSSMLTGQLPSSHGIVGNGWYFRDLAEVWLWRQSNRLVQGKKVWHEARQRDARATTLNMFWWYNMFAEIEYSVTPRPLYFADGRKSADVYGEPPDFRDRVKGAMPTFPLFNFWGPAADRRSTEWITEASIIAMKDADPTLTLVYLPHLDYDLQRFGPGDPRARTAIREVDACAGRLIDFARATGRRILVVSEYGLTEVRGAVHVNRALREAGFLRTTPIADRENLDAGASRAFAVADHQIAHVYVRDADLVPDVRRVVESLDGVERCLDRKEQEVYGLHHERSGELVAIAERDRWFSYYFWLDDAMAPDYARTVDIHRKPGYDPVELFLDPSIPLVKARIAAKVLKKKLGFRMLMDVIPLDTGLVRGSHGRLADRPDDGPILISSEPRPHDGDFVMTDVYDLILTSMFS